jgi:hypothetical protein
MMNVFEFDDEVDVIGPMVPNHREIGRGPFDERFEFWGREDPAPIQTPEQIAQERLETQRVHRRLNMAEVAETFDALSPLENEDCTNEALFTDDDVDGVTDKLQAVGALFVIRDEWIYRIGFAPRETLGDIDTDYPMPDTLLETSLIGCCVEFLRNNTRATNDPDEFIVIGQLPTVIMYVVLLMRSIVGFQEFANLIPADIAQMCLALWDTLYSEVPCAYMVYHYEPEYVLK